MTFLADTLMLLGDPVGALWEYRRAGDSVGMALALWHMGRREEALLVLPEDEVELRARMSLALGRPDAALLPGVSDTVRVWARVMLLDSGALEEAGEDSVLVALARQVLSSIPDFKDPVLAWRLSLVPGLGQLYAGSPRQALGSMLANGLGIGLFVWSVARREWVDLALIAQFITLRFYQGGMYNAYSAADKRNRKAYERWLDSLRARYPYPGVPLTPPRTRQ